MASLRLVLMWLVLLILLLASSETFGGRLPKILKKREAAAAAAAAATAPAAASSSVLIPHSEAKEFLSKLRRTKRNLWDRSRPDVQQWIMQFMYLGYDEQRLEADLSYWMDQSRSRDQGRQHHYDENAPIGPRDPSAYRHGANVNYDYY